MGYGTGCPRAAPIKIKKKWRTEFSKRGQEGSEGKSRSGKRT